MNHNSSRLPPRPQSRMRPFPAASNGGYRGHHHLRSTRRLQPRGRSPYNASIHGRADFDRDLDVDLSIPVPESPPVPKIKPKPPGGLPPAPASDVEVADGTIPAAYAPLWRRLYPDGEAAEAAIWIPAWIRRAVGTEARALVMSELLWWNQPRRAKQKKPAVMDDRAGRPRAGLYLGDEKNIFFAASKRTLALRTMLPVTTTTNAVEWLVRHDYIYAADGPNRTKYLQPNGVTLARRFAKDLQGDARTRVFQEIDATGIPDWTKSRVRRLAYERAAGTTVHAILIAVTGDPLCARTLSQLLSRFGDRHGRCVARKIRNGRLWWATSGARLARELGVSRISAVRALDALVAAGWVERCTEVYRAKPWHQRRRHTVTRPAFERIATAIREWHEANPQTGEEE